MLAELSNLYGVSGNETAVRKYLEEKTSGKGLDCYSDTMGNFFVRKGQANSTRKVMLSAHIDEIGLMVTAVEKGGLLKFKPVGGIDSRILVAKRVVIGSQTLPGVIGAKPIHLQKEGEQKKPFEEDSLFIDAGFKSRDEAEKFVSPGDFVAFDSRFTVLGKGYCRGKAFDNRAGCSILLELLLEDNGLAFDAAFTVQEEVGTRGAFVAAFRLKPQVALVIETTTAADTPETEIEATVTALGSGPAISFMDRSIMVSKGLREQLVEAAKAAGVPYQFRRFTGAATDGGVISLTREGVKTGIVAVPCRYIHSPHSVLRESDLEATKTLVRSWLRLQGKKGKE
ncbi:MAG: M42 family metallopeptidase [Bacillota bacterium]|nr:M42 family metallopeptidase [Bacillota bacterium]